MEENAIQNLEKALRVARIEGDQLQTCKLMGNLGLAYQANVDHKENTLYALGYLQNAYDLACNQGNLRQEGWWLGHLTLLKEEMGQIASPLPGLQQALRLAHLTGDEIARIRWLKELGDTYANASDFPTAIRCYLEALALCMHIEDVQRELELLGCLSDVYAVYGDLDNALTFAQHKISVAFDEGEERCELYGLFQNGFISRYGLQERQAVIYYERALKIAQRLEDPLAEVFAAAALADLYIESDEPHKALGYVRQALEFSLWMEDGVNSLRWLADLGNLHLELLAPRDALEAFRQAREFARSLHLPDSEALMSFNMAVTLDTLQRREEAREEMRLALQLWEALNMPDQEDARLALEMWEPPAP